LRGFQNQPPLTTPYQEEDKFQKKPCTTTLPKKEVLSKLARGESFYGVEIGNVDFSSYAFKKEMNFSVHFLNVAQFYCLLLKS
jgi:hypothetical protein